MCRLACRILVPQPGIEPGHSAVKLWTPKHWTAKEFPISLFKARVSEKGASEVAQW